MKIRKTEQKPKLQLKNAATIISDHIQYERSNRGNQLLHFGGHKYIKNNEYGQNVYWKCTKWHGGCKARAITNIYNSNICSTRNIHNHNQFFADQPNETMDNIGIKNDAKTDIDFFETF